jgi:hypothetical protein
MRDEGAMHDPELPPALRELVGALREDSDVPDRWRTRVLEQVGKPSAARRMPNMALLAAGLVLCAIGSAALLRARATPHVVALSEPGSPYESASATPVRFAFLAPGARRVSLVGDFDGWSPAGRPMRLAADGRTWEIDVPLPPGRHAFAFLVDGVLHADPAAARAVEDDFGVPSSVIVVASRGT